MKKVLLTGGTGFIGRNVLEFLGSKYNFLAPAKEELDLRNENEVLKYLEKNNIEVVIHAALIGEFGLKKGNILADNLQSFFNLIQAKRFYCKMIFFGSGAEYDKRRNLERVKEAELGLSIPVFDEYSLYKYICSEYIKKCRDIICLRLFGVYGKYDNYESKFISNAIVKNLLKKEIIINQNVVFDYLFINDLMFILDHFILNRAKFESYNVTPDESIDLIKISNIINEISDYKSKIIVLKNGLNNEYTGDNRRLKKEIPALKFTDYKEGINKLFKYYKRNLNKIDKDVILEDNYLKSVINKNKL